MSTCEYGDAIIQKESYFYKYHKKYKFKPKIYEIGESHIIMERINSQQVYKLFNESLQSSQFEILNMLDSQIS